jgi:hypothetical protein
MKKSLLIVFTVALAISMATSCIRAEDKVELSLKLKKGQTYKMKTVTDLKINQTIPGQQQSTTIDQKNETRNIYTVEDVQADGTLILKITHEGLFSKSENPNNPMESFEYDSTNPDSAVGPLAPILGAIVGQSFTITITPDGHVKEIQGANEILEHLQEKINELPEGPARAGVETNLKMQYGEEALKTNTENSFNMYPDNPISIGDTWQKRTTMTQGFPMIVNSIYTLKERKDGIAVIDVFAMIQPNREAGPMQTGEMKIYYNISGSVTGLIEMEESTGWTVRSNSELRLSGTATVSHPQMQQPMSIPISISGTVTQEQF